MNIKRILAVVLRQAYLYQATPTRLMEIFYWPTLDLLLWGFVTIYLQRATNGLPQFVSFFLGALILWNILFRSQQGITVSFLEDMWARNLANLFVTPLSLREYLSGLLLISFIKVVMAFSIMSTIAGVFYSFNIFKIGLALLPLVLILILMGWAIGLSTMSLILRFGQEAEILAWAVAFLFMPFSAVFYPLSVLPTLLQKIVFFLPSVHAFEGMRAVIQGGGFPWQEVSVGLFLDFFYLGGALLLFRHMYHKVLELGIIPKIGE